MASLSPPRPPVRRTTTRTTASTRPAKSKPAIAPDLAALQTAWPDEASASLRKLVVKLAALARGPLRRPGDRRWLARTVESAAESETAGLVGVYEALLWAHALPWLRGELPAGAVQELFDRLRRRTRRWPREGAAGLDAAELLACTELPLALAADPARDEARALGSRGVAALENWCSEVSKRGIVPANLLPWTPALAASWLRCRQLLKHAGLEFDAAALDRGVVLVRETLRGQRRDGRMLFGHCSVSSADRRWLVEQSQSLDAALPRLARAWAATQPPRGKSSLPPSSISSEDAGATVIRNSWRSASHGLGVRVAEARMDLELLAGGAPLLSGEIRTRVSADGVPLATSGVWEHICFESDDEGDYLEYGIDLERGWSIERHLFLPREEGVCLVADALLGERSAELEYELAIPLAAGLTLEPERETNDARLGPGRILPLALPEWRSAPGPRGQLTQVGSELVYRLAARGARRLFPLWIDLDRARRNQEATWRPLTVAEDRQICSPETVAAFRMQIGRRQWLLYRSLGERGNRTVLGQNLVYELTIGRLTNDGDMDKLVEIE